MKLPHPFAFAFISDITHSMQREIYIPFRSVCPFNAGMVSKWMHTSSHYLKIGQRHYS